MLFFFPQDNAYVFWFCFFLNTYAFDKLSVTQVQIFKISLISKHSADWRHWLKSFLLFCFVKMKKKNLIGHYIVTAAVRVCVGGYKGAKQSCEYPTHNYGVVLHWSDVQNASAAVCSSPLVAPWNSKYYIAHWLREQMESPNTAEGTWDDLLC